MTKYYVRLALLPLLTLVAACVGASKSATPLSPAVAGPIPGVNISAPAVVDPGANARIDTTQQPITLVVQNASTSGVRPLSYVFEIATDANFANKLFTRDGIPQDSSGRTSLRMPDPLSPERTYYWHAKAEDGANAGPFTAAINFNIFTPVVFQAPGPITPINNVKVDSLRPRFSFANAQRTGPAGAVSYIVELSDADSFASKIAVTVPEQAGPTNLDPTQDLPAGRQLFWHVRAFDPTTTGPWSATQVFQTPAAPAPGGGGGGGCAGGSCHVPPGPITADRAEQVVNATAAEFPNLMAGGPEEEILRRMIWHLQLAGFQAARQKNPSGAISNDKVSIFIDGAWHVYDVLSDNAINASLSVHFTEVPLPNPIPDGGIPD